MTEPIKPSQSPAGAEAPTSIQAVLTSAIGAQSASAAGNQASTPAPAAGQPDATKGTEPDKKPEEATNKEPEALEPQSEFQAKLAKELGLQVETETVEVWQKRHADSSREAQRLKSELKALADSLADQGLKPAKDKDGKLRFLPTEGFVAKQREEIAAEMFNAMTPAEKENLLADPEAFTKAVIQRVIERTVRPTPTASKSDIRLDERVVPALETEIRQEKFSDGKERYPDFELLKPWIDKVAGSSLVPPDFREYMMQSPDHYKFAVKAMYGWLLPQIGPKIAERMAREAKIKERKQRSENDASIGPGKTGSRGEPKTQTPETREANLAKTILTAPPVFGRR